MKKVLFLIIAFFLFSPFILANGALPITSLNMGSIVEGGDIFELEGSNVRGLYVDYYNEQDTFITSHFYSYNSSSSIDQLEMCSNPDLGSCFDGDLVIIAEPSSIWKVTDVAAAEGPASLVIKLKRISSIEIPAPPKAPNIQLLSSGEKPESVVIVTPTKFYTNERIVVTINNTGEFTIDDNSSYVVENGKYIFDPFEGEIKMYFTTLGDEVYVEAYAKTPDGGDSTPVAVTFIVKEIGEDPGPVRYPIISNTPTNIGNSGDSLETSDKPVNNIKNPNTSDYVIYGIGLLIISLVLTLVFKKNKRFFIN